MLRGLPEAVLLRLHRLSCWLLAGFSPLIISALSALPGPSKRRFFRSEFRLQPERSRPRLAELPYDVSLNSLELFDVRGI